MKTNLIHYLSLIYFVNQLLHVSSMFIANHQEVFTVYTHSNWYVLYSSIQTRPATSQLKHITCTICCTYTVNTS
jgi:hypothetical protein